MQGGYAVEPAPRPDFGEGLHAERVDALFVRGEVLLVILVFISWLLDPLLREKPSVPDHGI